MEYMSLQIPLPQFLLGGSEKKRIFKGKTRAVEVSNVMVQKYSRFLRKRSLPYLIFEFKNNRCGELFKKANEEILFEKVL